MSINIATVEQMIAEIKAEQDAIGAERIRIDEAIEDMTATKRNLDSKLYLLEATIESLRKIV